MKYLLLLILFSLPSLIHAQERADLRIKTFIGISTVSYLEQGEQFLSLDLNYGYQGGFGFRITKKRLMGEINFNFIKHDADVNYFGIDPAFLTDNDIIRIRSFELPINVGGLTIKTPLVKHFIYGGITTRFNLKEVIKYKDKAASLEIRPRDTNLVNPTFLMRLGTQIDIGFFNFDFNYSLGLNKSFKQITRVQTHFLEFNVGLIF